MTSSIDARLEARTLSLLVDGEPCLELPLDQGGRHRLVVAEPGLARSVIDALEDNPCTGILPASGGLPGAMTVAASFELALGYDFENSDRSRDWAADLESALRLCGLPAERIATIGLEQPMNLGRIERWTVGFARCLLRPPELLVIDRLFAGLSRREADALIAVEAVYHLRHPFRPVLFVDLDSHELPALPDCRTLTRLAETAETPCHC